MQPTPAVAPIRRAVAALRLRVHQVRTVLHGTVLPTLKHAWRSDMVLVRRLGLQARVTATVAGGALILSATIATVSYQLIRNQLMEGRERTAERSAFYDATVVNARLDGSATNAVAVLGSLGTGPDRRPLLRQGADNWFSLSTDVGGHTDIPEALQRLVDGGEAARQRVQTASGPAMVVGIPLSNATQYYEIISLAGLEQDLDVMGLVLGLVAGGATLAGGGLGWYTARRALRPLRSVAHAARGIARGDLSARLDPSAEPDLAQLTASFNDMVDQLATRIERDRRFAADVSHELRSPLQTLAAAAAVLQNRRGQLDERSALAAQLVAEEVDRFQRLVTDLIEITRADSELELSTVDVLALARGECRARGIDPAIVKVARGIDIAWLADGRRVERIVGNLLDNAQRHGGGAVAVRLRQRNGMNVIVVDDEGPGVLPEDRQTIFNPFVRGRNAGSRGDGAGTGLGLAIVARLADSHGGRVTVGDRPGGGARFRVELAERAP